MKVLIAVENLDTRWWMQMELAELGHDVQAVGSGLDAWEVMTSADPPQVMLLDWELSGLDGLALCRKARGNPLREQPYLILLLSEGNGENVRGALHAGADDYLRRPLNPDDLAARLTLAQRVMALQSQVTRQTEYLYNSLLEQGFSPPTAGHWHELLPMCAWCKQVRTEEEGWQNLEKYLAQELDIDVTHGICPECVRQLQARGSARPDSSPELAPMLAS
jgi:CheY-like chemotaxis protein